MQRVHLERAEASEAFNTRSLESCEQSHDPNGHNWSGGPHQIASGLLHFACNASGVLTIFIRTI